MHLRATVPLVTTDDQRAFLPRGCYGLPDGAYQQGPIYRSPGISTWLRVRVGPTAWLSYQKKGEEADPPGKDNCKSAVCADSRGGTANRCASCCLFTSLLIWRFRSNPGARCPSSQTACFDVYGAGFLNESNDSQIEQDAFRHGPAKGPRTTRLHAGAPSVNSSYIERGGGSWSLNPLVREPGRWMSSCASYGPRSPHSPPARDDITFWESDR